MPGPRHLPSLRTRLLAAMALALGASLVVGGVLAWLGAARSVQAELRAALDLARRTTEAAVAAAGGSHPDPAALLESLRGNRHLRATLLGPDGVALASPVLPAEAAAPGLLPVPPGLARLLGASGLPPPAAVQVGGGAALLLQAEPANEAREAWDDLAPALLALAFFAALAMLWVGRAVAAALRPLEALAAACGRIGAGDFAAPRLADRRPGVVPEVARLCDGFDRMAERLAAAEARGRRLRERLVRLRETERAAIARDLHDEVGPTLFAIAVDAANVRRLAARVAPAAEAEAIAEAAHNLAEATAQAQRGVRGLLGRLRPAAPVELGLGPALEELLAFWRRRRPEVAWELVVAPGSDVAGLDRVTAEACYRVAQEALGNAARHGEPGRVRMEVGRREGWLLLEVSDDGGGRGAASRPGEGREGTAGGLGLRGMAERVEGLGGRFAWRSEPLRGVTVQAALPLAAPVPLTAEAAR